MNLPSFPLQLFERATLRSPLPNPLSLPVSPCSRKSVASCTLDLWPPEAPGTEVTHWLTLTAVVCCPFCLLTASLLTPLPHSSYCSASSHIHKCPLPISQAESLPSADSISYQLLICMLRVMNTNHKQAESNKAKSHFHTSLLVINFYGFVIALCGLNWFGDGANMYNHTTPIKCHQSNHFFWPLGGR